MAEAELRYAPWDDSVTNVPEIETGTLLDEEVLFQAVSGVHTIIHLKSAQWWGRPRDLERIEIVGTRNLIAVARSARVGRIITISHLGASPASAYPILNIKGQVEEMVRGSGLAYTIIRSGLVFGAEDAFINHLAMMLRVSPGLFFMPGRGDVVLHPIYIDDLVRVICRSLDAVDVVDETVEVGGAEYITLADLLATIMRVTRIRRVVVPVPPYLLRWLTRFYGTFFRRTLMTPQWLDILASNRTAHLGNAYTHFQVQPRRVGGYFADLYARANGGCCPTIRYVFRRRPSRL